MPQWLVSPGYSKSSDSHEFSTWLGWFCRHEDCSSSGYGRDEASHPGLRDNRCQDVIGAGYLNSALSAFNVGGA